MTATTAHIGAETFPLDAELKRLRLENERLNALVNQAAVGICQLDLDSRVLMANDRFCEILGRPRQELIGRTTGFFTHAEDQAKTHAAFDRLAETRQPLLLEKRYVKPDGSLVWTLLHLALTLDAGNEPLHFSVVITDITERKRMELALLEERQRLEALNRVGVAFSAELDIGPLAQAITDAGTALAGAAYGAFFHAVGDKADEAFHLETVSSNAGATFTGLPMPRTSGLFLRTFRGEGIVRYDDVTQDGFYSARRPSDGNGDALPDTDSPGTKLPDTQFPASHPVVRSYMALPIVSRTGRVLGGLIFGHPEPGRFSERHERLLTGLAAQAAIAIDNAELFQDAQRQIEERKRAEAERELLLVELDAERGRLQAVLDSVPVGLVFAAAPSGEIFGANPQAERIFRHPVLPTPDIEAHGDWVAFHPDGRRVEGHEYPLARAVLKGEASRQEDYLYRRGDGTLAWIGLQAAPIRNRDGVVTGGVVAVTDIDAHRRNAEALQRLTSNLEAEVEERTRERDRIWQLSTDLLAVFGLDGCFLSVNPAWTATLGWTTAELIGSDCLTFIHAEDVPETRVEIAYIKGGGQPRQGYVARWRGRDGRYHWLSWNAFTADGRIYGVARDVTTEREREIALFRAQEQLRQAQKMEAVGQLTGGIAHDFNNLLTGIIGSLELMQGRIAKGRFDDLGRFLDAAMASGNRAAALTHRLLAFARRQTLDPKPTDANRLVAEMEELIRRTAGPAITLSTRLSPDLWTTLCDSHQLENALLNLSINARDAMPEGGGLTIATENLRVGAGFATDPDLEQGEYVVIEVGDDGIGMSDETMARVFEPFFTTKPIGQGTGLGLSMIYGFVKQSRGHVRIQSALGEGTRVRLFLPRCHDEFMLEPPPAPADVAEVVPEECVLVVDDEAVVRMLIGDVLDELGYIHMEAADAPEALGILDSVTRIDLLVTDVGLPAGMNGRQLAEAARQHRPGLKVLFITGYDETAAVGNGQLEAGMQVITKPFTMEALTTRIQTMLKAE